MAEMTKEVIVASCKANGGYAAPHLNDQLFLHCRGFSAIKNLEPYREAKVLWLEQNALSDLSGLEEQRETLVSLFLQNNFIRSLTTLTATLTGLRVLNVSHNYLTSLRGIASACPCLETLQASHNQLTSLEGCEELWQLAGSLTSVDLSFNRIETSRAPRESATATPATPASPATPAPRIAAAAVVLDDDIRIIDPADDCSLTDTISRFTANVATTIPAATTTNTAVTAVSKVVEDALCLVRFFQHLPLVSVVYMQGNGLSHRLRSYRRNMILHLPALTYLDERPIFPEERRVVEAWGRGGEDAETAERATIREEKRVHLTQCVKVLTEQREGQREMRDRLTLQFEQRRARELEELTQRRRKNRDDRAALESAEGMGREAVEHVEQDTRWDVEDTHRTAHAALASQESAHRHAYEQHVAVVDATQRAAADAQDASEVNTAAAVKVLEDAGTAAPFGVAVFTSRRGSVDSETSAAGVTYAAVTPSSALAELLQSDDDILRQMESEIDHVLYDVSVAGGRASSTPSSQPHHHHHNSHVDPAAEAPTLSYSRQQVTDRTTLRLERTMHSAVDHVASQLRAQPGRRGSAQQQQQRESVWQRFEQWEARRASLPAADQ